MPLAAFRTMLDDPGPLPKNSSGLLNDACRLEPELIAIVPPEVKAIEALPGAVGIVKADAEIPLLVTVMFLPALSATLATGLIPGGSIGPASPIALMPLSNGLRFVTAMSRPAVKLICDP